MRLQRGCVEARGLCHAFDVSALKSQSCELGLLPGGWTCWSGPPEAVNLRSHRALVAEEPVIGEGFGWVLWGSTAQSSTMKADVAASQAAHLH